MKIGINLRDFAKKGVLIPDVIFIISLLIGSYTSTIIMNRLNGFLGFGICGGIGAVHTLAYLWTKRRQLVEGYRTVKNE